MLKAQLSTQALNPQALEVCQALNKAGYQAYIVGGCVRDLLLGLVPKDWDITTDASPKKVMEIFPKTIATGLQHGTVTVVMGPNVENHFEVTTFRIEGEYKDGRRPEEVFFVMDVKKDLARRDLTINAIAYDPVEDLIVDPYDGVKDIHNGIIQAVGNPHSRFKEDGLRIMRVARFAARFGYTVSAETFDAMSANLDTLKKVSKERISDELSKTLMGAHSQYGMQLLQDSGALQIVSSLLNEESSMGLSQCQGELETKLAFLYLDSPTVDVERELMSLKFSSKETKKVVFLLQLLERFNKFVNADTANAYKSFMALIKNHAPDTCEHTLNQFIELTEALQYESKALFTKYQNEIVFSKKEMQINGNDLMEIGIKPGPQIKSLLENCYLEILKNPDNNNKQKLLDIVSVMKS